MGGNGPCGDCHWCGRGRNHENTIPKQIDGEYLPFMENLNECYPCNHYIGTCWRKKTRAALENLLQTDQGRANFNSGLGSWEVMFWEIF
jgi:hypothetical protein